MLRSKVPGISADVSDFGKGNALKRAVAVNPSAAIGHADVAKRGNPFPPIALDLVVDWMIYMRGSMGAAASLELWWEDEFSHYNPDFRAMSLVHRSWTPIAQRALRNRAEIKSSNIEKFLLTPFCGSEITEMIIFWEFDDGRSFPTEKDIRLLRELTRRNPNVQSLLLDTSLAWYSNDYSRHSLEIDICFELIVKRLPCLENLLLRHHCMHTPDDERDELEGLIYCPGLPVLCAQLPSMVSLKRLSIRGWTGVSTMDWNKHPPARLKAVELDYLQPIDEQNLKWLVSPRGEFSLASLFVSIQDYPDDSTPITIPKDCLSKIKRLTLYVRMIGGRDGTLIRNWCQNLLGQCEELVDLDFVIKCQCSFMKDLLLPSSLERVSVHYYDDLFDRHVPQFSALDPAGRQLAGLLQRNLPRLPRLRTLLVTTQSLTWYRDDRHLAGDTLPRHILELCRDRGVEVIR